MSMRFQHMMLVMLALREQGYYARSTICATPEMGGPRRKGSQEGKFCDPFGCLFRGCMCILRCDLFIGIDAVRSSSRCRYENLHAGLAMSDHYSTAQHAFLTAIVGKCWEREYWKSQ